MRKKFNHLSSGHPNNQSIISTSSHRHHHPNRHNHSNNNVKMGWHHLRSSSSPAVVITTIFFVILFCECTILCAFGQRVGTRASSSSSSSSSTSSSSSSTHSLPISVGSSSSLVTPSLPYYGTLLGRLNSHHHDASGDVYAVDESTIFIKGFTYDGTGPDAYFWAGNTQRPDPSGFIIPDEKGS